MGKARAEIEISASAQRLKRQTKPVAAPVVNRCRYADTARRAHLLQASRNDDAVAMQIVSVDDHVAQIHSYA